MKNSGGAAQFVQINIEENALRSWIIKLFMPNLRMSFGVDNWGKYFLVRRGITNQIRDGVGLLNSKVGYTYLLDGDCKIRWAGSGISEGDEKQGLVKGVRKLIEDSKNRKPAALPPSQVEEATEFKANGESAASS